MDKSVYYYFRVLRKKEVKDLAEELMVSKSYIHAIENGTKEPSVRLFRDYAKALGIDQEVMRKLVDDSKKFSIERIMIRLLKEVVKNEEQDLKE